MTGHDEGHRGHVQLDDPAFAMNIRSFATSLVIDAVRGPIVMGGS